MHTDIIIIIINYYLYIFLYITGWGQWEVKDSRKEAMEQSICWYRLSTIKGSKHAFLPRVFAHVHPPSLTWDLITIGAITFIRHTSIIYISIFPNSNLSRLNRIQDYYNTIKEFSFQVLIILFLVDCLDCRLYEKGIFPQ